MSLTAKVLKLDREQMRVTTIYEIIGKFGNRLPKVKEGYETVGNLESPFISVYL